MRLIGYVRVSDKEQVKKGFSIEAQQEDIEAWCLENGHELVRVVVEPGRSGSKSYRVARPAFERAVNTVLLADPVDGLVVKWMDRFARNVEDFLHVRSQFIQADKTIISINEPVLNGDPTEPVARYIATSIMAAHQLQAELSGRKAAMGRERRAKQGHYPGSLPMGYVREERNVIIDKETGPMVVQAFNEFSSGRWTLDEWVKESNKRGYKTRRGKNIAKSTWHRIFRSKFYVGRYTWKDVEYEGLHESLIDEGVFGAVQEILDAYGHTNRESHFWLLAGLLWSESHSNPMTGAGAKGGKFTYYRASVKGLPDHNVSTQELENRVIEYLSKIIWPDNIYRAPEEWQLAIRAAKNMGEIYPHLATKFEQRNFLRMIFFKRGIQVSGAGVIFGVKLRHGCRVQIP